ncbi:MAG: non-homologous end joining protein Ku [Betaproteobacteria bacterium]
MAARAMWKGKLVIGEQALPVKMYSAARERTVHFRLLDKETLSPVHQRIVRKTDGKEVAKEDRRKAVPLDGGRAVLLTAEDLEALEPRETRDIRFSRFVPVSALNEQWYEKPYWLGPEKDAKAYFALMQALTRAKKLGIARWAMRKKRYVGALSVLDGHLMMTTLRRADQVLAVPQIEPAREPNPKELKLAERLLKASSGRFDPAAWQDEYHDRVCALLEAKAKGRLAHIKSRKRAAAKGSLAQQLKKSLSGAKERKVA